MSKSLKKLIDINRLREFKNKLVGAGSAYVQTTAVDQTISGTKTFSKPIVGSVTGSSGSCTGNAATATKATQDAAGNTITTTYATKAENNTKANDSDVVHKSGDETINGVKNFTREIVSTSLHVFRQIVGKYGVFWRNDGNNLYLMLTNSGDQYGGWNDFRPLVVNLATGICNINGNANSAGSAGSATNATYANWLRTSSHSDHLFHTEWDNAGYFWTYVTAGDGGYRAVRVARSDSAANADSATKAIFLLSNSHDYHEIRFDWSRQIDGHVGIRVDATDLGGIVTTDTLVPELRRIGLLDIGSTIHACTGIRVDYGETVAGSQLKYAAFDTGGGIYDLNYGLTTIGTWLKVSGNSGNTSGFGLYRRIA